MEKYLAYILLSIVSTVGFSQQLPDYGNNKAAGSFLVRQGVKIYYEVYGQGKPLIIIHGNGGSIRGRATMIEKLSKKYAIFIMDNRCHGKSDCPVGPVTYEQMAADLNAILVKQGISSAYVWGHSDGGNIGLIMAIDFPDKVSKMLISGANLRPDTTAIDPAILPVITLMEEAVKGDSVGIKRLKLLTEQPNIKAAQLRQIKAEVLVMIGDRDVIRPDHALEIFNGIDNSYLCVLPATTHMVFQDREQWFDQILIDFFDNPQQQATTVELMKKMYDKK